MNRIFRKLVLAVFLLIISSVMIIAVTYAWLSLSTSPTVSGIQVGIGGGRTIMLAPDITEVVTDGNGNQVTVHYPGEFSDHMVLSQYPSYAYLQNVSALTPVSTADGINWIIPAYDPSTGMIMDTSEFSVDTTLSGANTGKYVCIDFWVVSPGSDYKLRVSTDVKTGTGSFVIEHPDVVDSNTEVSGFSLVNPGDYSASIARVGFLVNTDTSSSDAMLAYSRSNVYQSRYSTIHGVYNETGASVSDPSRYKFTIYEPNATRHPWNTGNEGNYVITSPLTYDSSASAIVQKNISDILTVQKNNTWKTENSRLMLIDQLQTALAGKSGFTKASAKNELYYRFLQGQVGAFANSGEFFQSTASLYSLANNGVVDAGRMNQYLICSGSTEDVYITTLEKNVPQRIRMFIWLEGQDADCTNDRSVPASDFSVELELAGADE